MTTNDLCTVKRACASEQIGRTTLYKRINNGDCVAYELGGSTRLSIQSLLAFRKRISPKKASATATQGDAANG